MLRAAMASAMGDALTMNNDGIGEGINFRVVDVDTFSSNEVVGRCFCPAARMREAMERNTPIVMSLGEGCARKVALSIVYAFPEPYT